MSHVHAFPMHMYSLFNILDIFETAWDFSNCHSFSPFLLVVSMAPKHKSTPARNLLHSGASSFLFYLISSSMMMMPIRHSWRTFLEEVFIRNAKSYWRTSLALTFPLSFTVENGSHCVRSQSLVLLCSFMSFTPTCTGLIVQYLSSLLAIEVRAFLSHRSLLQMCFEFIG